MAKIYISYSQKDKRTVKQYVKYFEKHDQQILMDDTVLNAGDDFQKKLMEAQQESDGTIVFITSNSIESEFVNNEIELAKSYKEKEGKFLIPLVKGKVNVPDIIRNLNYIQIENKTVDEIVRIILDAIEKRSYQKEEPPIYEQLSREENKESKTRGRIYSKTEATEIQTTLRALNIFHSQIDGIAGPATTKAIEGFQALYHLPVTREWDEQTKSKADEILKSREVKQETHNKETKQQEGPPKEERPKAAETKQEQPQNNDDPKYWLLKIYGDDWGLGNLSIGSEGYFNAHFNNYQPRTEYEDFKSVKKGELGFAYDYSSQKSIVFSYEVTESLHNDPERDEIFNFKITRFFDPALPLTEFISLIGVADELQSDSLKKLFALTKSEYETIINRRPLQVGSDPDAIRTSISAIFSDSATKDLKDQLGFKSDVNALASVIAYKEVKPPLAIGLFGNWGSGKSFFMNKLEQRIDYLSKKGGDAFCKKVLSITFNSWHYSDSNLWASLITKIFEELEKYGEGEKDKVSELFKNLNSTKELLQETEIEKAKVDKQISGLEKEKKVFDDDATKQANELSNLSAGEMIATALENEGIKEKIGNLKKEYPFLELNDNDSNSIKENIADLKDGSDKFLKSLKIIYSFRKGKIWLAVLCILIVFGAVYYVTNNTEGLKKLSEGFKIIIGTIAVVISKVILFLRPAMKTVNTAYNKLEEINVTVDDLKAEAMSKFSKKQEELQQKLDNAKNEGSELQKKIDLLAVQQQQLQNEIDDITTGRKIIRFIESRVTDQRYINSLGIISWIRKDFEQLNVLLKQQVQAKQVASNRTELEKTEFELERIILYIDDLDRCDESIVVKVLEAIHLLLAFPLFVVVVGVDPRWMHNALNKKYADFLSGPQELKSSGNGKIHRKGTNGTLTGKEDNAEPDESLLHAATSFDYLEKIFQIPFVLKPMDNTGKSNLIRSQLEPKKDDKKMLPAGTNGKDIPAPTLNPATEPKTETDAEKIKVTPIDTLMEKGNIQPETLIANTENLSNIDIALKITPIVNPTPPVPDPEPDDPEENDEEEQQDIPIATETLKISEDEIKFMQNISFLIGESPRTIKRYINIYRIIRTHTMFEFCDNDLQEHYEAAMLMLALITGYPDEARDIIGAIEISNKAWTVNDFLNDYLTRDPSSTALKILDHEIKSGKKITEAGNIKIEKFQKNLALICRFSFRRLN